MTNQSSNGKTRFFVLMAVLALAAVFLFSYHLLDSHDQVSGRGAPSPPMPIQNHNPKGVVSSEDSNPSLNNGDSALNPSYEGDHVVPVEDASTPVPSLSTSTLQIQVRFWRRGQPPRPAPHTRVTAKFDGSSSSLDLVTDALGTAILSTPRVRGEVSGWPSYFGTTRFDASSSYVSLLLWEDCLPFKLQLVEDASGEPLTNKDVRALGSTAEGIRFGLSRPSGEDSVYKTFRVSDAGVALITRPSQKSVHMGQSWKTDSDGVVTLPSGPVAIVDSTSTVEIDGVLVEEYSFVQDFLARPGETVVLRVPVDKWSARTCRVLPVGIPRDVRLLVHGFSDGFVNDGTTGPANPGPLSFSIMPTTEGYVDCSWVGGSRVTRAITLRSECGALWVSNPVSLVDGGGITATFSASVKSLEVQVEGVDPKVLSSHIHQLVLWAVNEESKYSVTWSIDADGKFRPPLPPGRWSFRVTLFQSLDLRLGTYEPATDVVQAQITSDQVFPALVLKLTPEAIAYLSEGK